ncbi:uncharacterized protein CTRU02_204984 [Colletotrichum truncatum]|uniref:Uncharacterized protein n=1 Tax=Colletotrichum truncatum TaxID=5467 RepID=A0ACC3Z2Q1_COLTU|nr:uncharacterized protein CTRU02_06187 [Colletotrichum truncatum]KAF6793315.1 hypothetical protein CTRU02_06187 [Colletotrichum truncatum]
MEQPERGYPKLPEEQQKSPQDTYEHQRANLPKQEVEAKSMAAKDAESGLHTDDAPEKTIPGQQNGDGKQNAGAGQLNTKTGWPKGGKSEGFAGGQASATAQVTHHFASIGLDAHGEHRDTTKPTVKNKRPILPGITAKEFLELEIVYPSREAK